MAGAGFYAIHTDTIRFRSDGRWYADAEPITHPRLALLFSRHLRRKPDGSFEIWIDERYHADVEVEDVPYVVTAVEVEPTGITIELNDGSREPLDASSLNIGDGDVLYCSVKDGRERARFLRPAYHHLAPLFIETDDGFALRVGEHTHRIAVQG